jgi:DNA polymerase-3 subunit alpha
MKGVSRMGRFVHLHVHTEYSLLDGAARIEKLVKQAKVQEMQALAITDHGAMYGVVPFYQACKQEGIHPIIGCEVYLTSGDHREKPNRKEQKNYHLLLLAETDEGYRHLMKLVTEAHLHGFHYKPRVDKALLRKYAKGLIATSSCLAGEIPQAILQGNMEQAKRLVWEYLEIFGSDHFFFELQDHRLPEQQRVNRQLIAWSKEMGIPLLATNDVHYVRREDHDVHDCLLCVGTGSKLSDEKRLRFHSDQFYFKTEEEMARLFSYVPEALNNTWKVAERCQVTIPFGQKLLPKYPVPNGMTAKAYLREKCLEGVARRYSTITPEIKKRLEYELAVIDTMGFNDYFLVVWDFVRFAHDQGIAVGPGRGSAAGSLVAYVLFITDVDPIRYNLLFERFLNPERVSLPDIDIDFNFERRDEVIHYVQWKYGEEHVAQMMELPYHKVDQLAKLIPSNPGMTLEKAYQLEPSLQKLKQYPDLAKLLQYAEEVEGLPRHASTHAAGVVISPAPITQYVPLQEGTEGIPLTQYPMEVLEKIGLLKADFLGLRNLTIIERAQKIIEQQTGQKIAEQMKQHDDPATYELLASGETLGVFQMESAGMRRVLQELRPNCFEDIIAVLALYRPGPMEQIPRFIRAKHGEEKVTYPHPDLEKILKNTYGIIVYQEQIMQIAAKMAGFTLGQADLLRRAVGKKNRELLDQQKTAFIEGCIKNGYSRQIGEEVYDLILRFANYGFNRSHSAAYAVLAYQTAYLKAHYPLAFMTALLTTVMGNQGKMIEYVNEAKRMGIAVLPPDISKSEVAFSVEKGSIRFGLAAIKNVGLLAIQEIIKARKSGAFRDLFDFCRRVNTRLCNRRVMEALIQCGAMDSLPGHRTQKLAMLDEAIEHSSTYLRRQSAQQMSLFTEEMEEDIEKRLQQYRQITPYTQKEKLQFEKELLGLYLSGHPLDQYQMILNQARTHRIVQLPDERDQQKVRVSGMITEVKRIKTKKGEAMAFIKLEDETDTVEVVIFPRLYHQVLPLLQEEKLIEVMGNIDQQEKGVKLIAHSCRELPKSQSSKLTKVFIRLGVENENPAKLERLKQIFINHRGTTPVYLYYERTRKLLELPIGKYGITLTEECSRQIERLLGPKAIHIKE